MMNRYRRATGHPYLLSCSGNEEPIKNLDTIWRALPAIRRAVPEVTLLVAGPKPLPSRHATLLLLA